MTERYKDPNGAVIVQGGPKKVSHCHESSLNRIKTPIKARFFINFDYKMSTRI